MSPYELYIGNFGTNFGDLSHQRQISEELQISGQIGRHKYVGGLYFFDEHVGEEYTADLTVLDVGLPPGVGLWLGLTGARLGGADAKALGLVTHLVDAASFPAILALLSERPPGDLDAVDLVVYTSIWRMGAHLQGRLPPAQ